ncbi:hypothetical protein B566_EDAN002857 [Ephemera danica]|nr:hypothetical protein B566_EDAN002857 [Ephemera danica]
MIDKVLRVANPTIRSVSRLSTANTPLSETITKYSSPLEHPDYFGVCSLVRVSDLHDNKVHLGHKEGSLHPSMRQYVLGARLGHTIIDIDITAGLLRRALQVTAHIVYRGGLVLFLSPPGRPILARATENLAKEVQEFAHARPWRKGTFTNSEKLFNTVTRLPDLCVFLATPHEAIKDAAKMNIPSIGILDTNSDPEFVTYHVPGNDDSPSAIQLYCKLFSQTVLQAKKLRSRDQPDIDGIPTVKDS